MIFAMSHLNMKRVGDSQPAWWQWTLLLAATLLLCSCAAPAKHPHAPSGAPCDASSGPGMACDAPVEHMGPGPMAYAPFAGEASGEWCGGPIPCDCVGPCGPQTCREACPADEYIFDGGDRAEPVGVTPDWNVQGLNIEDTVAHFDAVQGNTVVVPSNCVPIYAPRFAAVRVVHSPNVDLQIDALRGQERRVPPLRLEDAQLAAHSKQHLQLGRQEGTKKASGFRVREYGEVASQALLPKEASGRFKAYENLSIIRYGIYQQDEKPRLAKVVQAAYTWTRDQAVQVVLDGDRAASIQDEQKPEITYTIDSPGKPKLRIIKVASKQFAEPGDIVEFTLRFDNVGTQVIGNVTILDNLTTRLEYIPGTAQSSVKTNEYERDETGGLILEEVEVERSAVDGGDVERVTMKVPKRKQNPVNFSTSINNADSSVLRWEIQEPLEIGQGGILRFQCRVR